MRAISIIAIFAVGFAAVAALSEEQRNIIGGTETTIGSFPYISALLHTSDFITYRYSCVGVIINNRSILSVANCFFGDTATRWRMRVGSTFANSGGTIHNAFSIIIHENYEHFYSVNDIAILRSSSAFSFGINVSTASIAGTNYVVADYQPVRAVGWGAASADEQPSEQLRNLQLWNIHHQTCKRIYWELAMDVRDENMCSGWFDYPNHEDCLDSAGVPIIHNNVIVGVSSWGTQCTQSRFPAVSTRISSYTAWIQSNA